LLNQNALKEWLAPARQFSDITLHFASAYGVRNTVGAVDGFRPRRVLRPLLSLLDSVGLVSASTAKSAPAA
jgi:hypothetical protein